MKFHNCVHASIGTYYHYMVHLLANTQDHLISVGYGITILDGHLPQKNKRMVWNNRIGWKKNP